MENRPHEGLIRADQAGFTVDTDQDMPILHGRFANPGEWIEINSRAEGHFMERFSPGAFEKTVAESAKNMKVLFHHGLDPSIGPKPLGAIRSLNPDTTYEVDLLDVDYCRSLIPGLKAGLYGSSFQFDVVKDDLNHRPTRSALNPKGVPEVTITEAKVTEFGPTVVPHYKGTSAGLRAVSVDELALLAAMREDPQLFDRIAGAIRAAALPQVEPPDGTRLVSEPQHSAETETREEEKPSWYLEY